MAAQEMGLLNRDLKPGNVMVSWLPSGTYNVKILDFGMAKYAPLPAHQTEDQNKAILFRATPDRVNGVSQRHLRP
jgi:serine/threonine protein kinase